MASFLFDKAREDFLNGGINWASDTIKIVAVDEDDITPPASNASNPVLGDISTGIVGSAVTLGSKTSTGGVADAGDPTFSGLTGDEFEAFYIYDDTHASDRLICRLEATGLPFTPSGSDLLVRFDDGSTKIFKL